MLTKSGKCSPSALNISDSQTSLTTAGPENSQHLKAPSSSRKSIFVNFFACWKKPFGRKSNRRQSVITLAGNKRRSLSAQGGTLLNKMFGSGGPAKETQETSPTTGRSHSVTGVGSIPDNLSLKSVEEDGDSSKDAILAGSSLGAAPETQEKKRRSSGIAKAGALLSHAKNSFHLPGSPHSNSTSDDGGPLTTQASAIQKLGKTDPALSIPQGSLNNSAGESRPGPRSTFRIGVTEDRNKKCRRTMEDTHAYLYNFLSTPAPSIAAEAEPESSASQIDNPKEPHTPSFDTKSAISKSPIVETDNGYFAIFDGHAGTFAADWCGKKLHVILEDTIRKNPNTPIPELLDATFTSVDKQLDKLPLKNSGCTAICAVLRWEDRVPNQKSATGSTAIAPAAAAAVKAASDPVAVSDDHSSATLSVATSYPRLQHQANRQRVLYTANVGDARIVLCRNGKACRLSYDHKGSDENEGKRISNAGGLILNNRVNGVLAVTRALGDAYMKDLVTGHPYTTETIIQPDTDEFLILACDGLWDVCTDQEAVDLIRHNQDPQAASKHLVEYALSRYSTDNLSCMVVRFDGKALQQTLEHKKEPIGVEGDPASTKKGGMSETDAKISEARKGMPNADVIPSVVAAQPEEKSKPGPEVIKEEEEGETVVKPEEKANGEATK